MYFFPDLKGLHSSTLALSASYRSQTALSGGDSQSDFILSGSITNFSLQFPGGDSKLIVAEIAKFSFQKISGANPHFDIVFGEIHFAGQLQYVETIADNLKSLFSSAGMQLQILVDRIKASLALPVPDIDLAAFSVANVCFLTTLQFQFFETEKALRLIFSLSSRQNPFELAIGIYKGGGYFSVEMTPKGGLESIDMALEFGLKVGFSIGPILGRISVAGGIYYHKGQDTAVLAGYVHLQGKAKALGWLGVSIDLTVETGYAVINNTSYAYPLTRSAS